MTVSVLERVKRMAIPVKPRHPEAEAQQIEVLAKQIKEGESLLESLWPIEEAAKRKVAEALAPLKKQWGELMRNASSYKRLSLEPLTWRDKNGWPNLAVFDLRYPKVIVYHYANAVRFAGDGRYGSGECTQRQLHYPDAILKCYQDLGGKLGNRAVEMIFTGTIPMDVKLTIGAAKSMFDKIFIITEAKNWQVQMLDPDPLVVGWDGEGLWLIDAFDVTPLEAAMAFTIPGVSTKSETEKWRS